MLVSYGLPYNRPSSEVSIVLFCCYQLGSWPSWIPMASNSISKTFLHVCPLKLILSMRTNILWHTRKSTAPTMPISNSSYSAPLQLLSMERCDLFVHINPGCVTLKNDCLCLVHILRELEWRILFRTNDFFFAGTFLFFTSPCYLVHCVWCSALLNNILVQSLEKS